MVKRSSVPECRSASATVLAAITYAFTRWQDRSNLTTVELITTHLNTLKKRHCAKNIFFDLLIQNCWNLLKNDLLTLMLSLIQLLDNTVFQLDVLIYQKFCGRSIYAWSESFSITESIKELFHKNFCTPCTARFMTLENWTFWLERTFLGVMTDARFLSNMLQHTVVLLRSELKLCECSQEHEG